MTFRTILLHSNSFSERAESTQFIALARELEERFDVRSVIAYDKFASANNEKRLAEARRLGLDLFPYANDHDLRKFAARQGVDLSFVATDGTLGGGG